MSDIDLPFLLVIIAALLVYLLPFFINAVLAKSRGKSIMLMLLLTFIFTWIVTLILAFMPKVKTESLEITRDYGKDDFRMS